MPAATGHALSWHDLEAGADADSTPPKYCCVDSMLAHGPDVLHGDFAAKLERAAGGRALPQLEVRVTGVSLAAKVSIRSDGDERALPTVFATLQHALVRRATREATRHILRDVSAVFRPATMTLVLGQPGSGKSALLQLLAGRFPVDGKTIQFAGEVTYNGVPQREAAAAWLPQAVALVGQEDHHLATLTVQETLAFAHACCGRALAGREPDKLAHSHDPATREAVNAMDAHAAPLVAAQLGLTRCQHTIVGDGMQRGVSGGEKKRVTLGEMAFGNRLLTLLDEVTTGLDSAATLDILTTQRSLATHQKRTVVAALLQPSPEVFALFDDVLLLSEGRVIYHGPRAQAVPFFAALGYVCPRDRDVADFLLDLATDEQYKYYREPRLSAATDGRFSHFQQMQMQKQMQPRRTRVQRPAEFARAFRASTLHRETLAALAAPLAPWLEDDVRSHLERLPRFRQPFWPSVGTLLARELRVLRRDTAFLQGRAAKVVVVALLFAALFFQLDATEVQLTLRVLFASILFLAMGQASTMSIFMTARDVFYKQRAAHFFSTRAYVLAVALGQLPLALAETVAFGALIYWLCGLAASAGAFLVFELVLFTTTLAFTAWFFFLSALSPNLQVGDPLGTVSVLLFVLFAGFIITLDNIPSYFLWAYWVNPFAWCLRALAVNQYTTGAFDGCELDGVDYCAVAAAGGGDATTTRTAGQYLLAVFEVQSGRAWVWYGVLFMVAMFVGFMTLTAIVLERVRYDAPSAAAVAATLTSDERREAEGASSLCATVRSSQDDPDFDGENDDDDHEASAYQSMLDLAVDMASARFERHCVPVALAFQDLHYAVPDPADASKTKTRVLLNGVSGYARPRTLTALMGSSGAGKTTLLDVLAGRKTAGTRRGDIFLNGFPASDLAVRRATGYCEQADVHLDSTTFREALLFSAFLRQDASVEKRHKVDAVDECLAMLDLRAVADRVVRGSSMEQQKRLTIGVELAAQPSVLFLDEPTSGLDARAAKVVMDAARRVAATGRTVLCTIHQPSTDVFALFDNVLLLQRGGEVAYFGSARRAELARYFEAIPGVPRLPARANAAAWMLEVVGAGVQQRTATTTPTLDFVAAFHASAQRSAMDRVLAKDGLTVPAPGATALRFESTQAAPASVQFRALFRRLLDLHWRTPDYSLVRFAILIVLALVFGLAFRSVSFATFRGLHTGVGMVFVALVFTGGVAFESVLPLAGDQRPVVYRERAAQTYSSVWFVVASTLAELPSVALSCLAFCAVFLPLTGVLSSMGGGDVDALVQFALFWLGMTLHVLLQTYIGELVVYATPGIETAKVVAVLYNAVGFLFTGYMPPVAALPAATKWVHAVVPQKYAFAALGALVFGECHDADSLACAPLAGELPPDTPRGTTVQQYVAATFHLERDEVAENLAILTAFVVALRVVTWLVLRFVNHQKR